MKLTGRPIVFTMVDIQERFVPHIPDMKNLTANACVLNKFAELMDIPLLVTEQNPQGLGKTVSSIYLPSEHKLMTKNRFSIFEPDIEKQIASIFDTLILKNDVASNLKVIVLYGIETHVCITLSVLEALEKNYIPVVVADAVSSISKDNKEIGLSRIRAEGAIVVSTEMLLFELLGSSFHPNFKAVSTLIKESKKK